MSRAAIIGSCITRDLWPVRGAGLSAVHYVSRTSLASLFAPQASGITPAARPPGGLHAAQHRAMVADLQKTALAGLLAAAPTHLILDFIDERFDLVAAGAAVALRSWELEASGYLQQPALAGAREIPRLSPACERLWDEGLDAFAALVRGTPLRTARLILHSARWAERSRDPAGDAPLRDVEILPGRPADIARHNALLARYEARLLAALPGIEVVAAPALRIADAGHAWGLSPFHYVPEYYAEIARQLRALGVEAPPQSALRSDSAA